jgi:hypothetical protein
VKRKRLDESEYISSSAAAVQWTHFLCAVLELEPHIPPQQQRATRKLASRHERDRRLKARAIFEPALAPGFPAWDVTAQSRAEYEARARMLFERLLRRYCERCEENARTCGFARTPAQHNPKHYRWLAGYQYYGWSKNAIAEATGKDRAGVVRAIQRLAAELELNLRPPSQNDRTWTAAKIRTCLSPCDLKPTRPSHM